MVLVTITSKVIRPKTLTESTPVYHMNDFAEELDAESWKAENEHFMYDIAPFLLEGGAGRKCSLCLREVAQQWSLAIQMCRNLNVVQHIDKHTSYACPAYAYFESFEEQETLLEYQVHIGRGRFINSLINVR